VRSYNHGTINECKCDDFLGTGDSKTAEKAGQARIEMRLEVVQVKGDRQRAEQKVANARVHFEVASARLRTLEEELARLQGDSQSK
jgi:hypothetical protein